MATRDEISKALSANAEPEVFLPTKVDWIEPTRERPFMAYHSKLASDLSKARTRGEKDPFLPAAATVDGTTIFARGKLPGPVELKLLMVCQWLLLEQGQNGQRVGYNVVQIPTSELAELWGADYHFAPPDDSAELDKRSKAATETFKRKIRDALHNLASMNFDYSDGSAKRSRRYAELHVIGSHSVGDYQVEIHIDTAYASILMSNHRMTRYPEAFWRIDDRSENAVAIAYKLLDNYSLYNNVLHGQDNFLSVAALLNVTSYSSLDAIQQIRTKAKTGKETGSLTGSKRTWRDMILKRLIDDLDYLTSPEVGLLKSWKFTGPKHTPVDQNPQTIASYSALVTQYYIEYEMLDYPSSKKRFDDAKDWDRKRKDKSRRNRERTQRRKIKQSYDDSVVAEAEENTII